jgi:hypothetical protein
MKKGNNSKMGNGIYFKIAGYIDLDMLNMFACIFFFTFTAFGYSNNQREATLLQNVK